jgi:hypothetical protein
MLTRNLFKYVFSVISVALFIGLFIWLLVSVFLPLVLPTLLSTVQPESNQTEQVKGESETTEEIVNYNDQQPQQETEPEDSLPEPVSSLEVQDADQRESEEPSDANDANSAFRRGQYEDFKEAYNI